jgi:hypothetical protein
VLNVDTSSFVTSQNAEDIGLPRDKRIVILASGMVSGIENIATASGKGRTQSLPSENLNGRQSKHAGFLTFPSGRDRSEKGPVASGTNQAGM